MTTVSKSLVARITSGAIVLVFPVAVWAQAPASGAASLRPYWHVFAAYALAWILIAAWLITIVRRLGRVERQLHD